MDGRSGVGGSRGEALFWRGQGGESDGSQAELGVGLSSRDFAGSGEQGIYLGSAVFGSADGRDDHKGYAR
jgi:hypothetical protein